MTDPQTQMVVACLIVTVLMPTSVAVTVYLISSMYEKCAAREREVWETATARIVDDRVANQDTIVRLVDEVVKHSQIDRNALLAFANKMAQATAAELGKAAAQAFKDVRNTGAPSRSPGITG